MADISTQTERIRRYVVSADSPLNAYSVRFLMALATALVLVAVAVRVPTPTMPGFVGWSAGVPDHLQLLPDIETEEEPRDPLPDTQGAPITAFGDEGTPSHAGTKTPGQPSGAREEAEQSREDARFDRIEASQLTVTNPDQQPSIQGGAGALYMRIQYPQAARDQGIQGRVTLNFTVGEDGTTRDIDVIESLHPLCDSSAVRAVRLTRFVPGRQNGEAVPVRMNLPIKFRLVNHLDDQTTADAKRSDPS